MKKFTAILTALMLVAAATVTAFAAGINSYEQAVLDELETTVEMDDGTMEIPDEFINQAENYFNTIDMTEEESNEIIAILKEGEAFVGSTGASNIADMTYAQKEELLAYGQQAVAVIGCSMTYEKTEKTLYIYSPEGETTFEATPTLTPVDGSSSSTTTGGSSSGTTTGGTTTNNTGVIKTTGAAADFSGFAAIGAVAALAMAFAAVYAVKTRKKAA